VALSPRGKPRGESDVHVSYLARFPTSWNFVVNGTIFLFTTLLKMTERLNRR
jgi:hypothetical protein